jgi:hopanoid biosynthesis associated protein HpnK
LGELKGAGFAWSPSGGPPGHEAAFSPHRRVIFSADDFGLSPWLNTAVLLAHRQGVLGCASVMAGGRAASQALALARDHPSLCLGVHLTLAQGRAVLPPRAIPKLVDRCGNFPKNPVVAGLRSFARPGLLPEIRRELAAQIEAVLAAGLRVWHLNSHLNLHLHPTLLPLVVDLAREYSIPALRLPREDWRLSLRLYPRRLLPQVAVGLIFMILCRRAAALAREAGLVVNDHLFGLLQDGCMTEHYLLKLIPRLPPGLTEIYSHPAVAVDAALRRAAPGYQRQEEYQALVSPRVARALAAGGIKVTDFREVARGLSSS